MGDSVQQWRCRIGSFMQPLKTKYAFQTLCVRLTYVSLSLRLALFGMLLAQGIESNPGPGPGSTGSSRGRNSGGSVRGRGTGRGRGGTRGGVSGGVSGRAFSRAEPDDFFADVLTSGQSRRVTRSSQIVNEAQSSQQQSISNWLTSQPSQQGQNESRHVSPVRSATDSDTDIDQALRMDSSERQVGGMPMNILLDIQRSINRLDKKFDNIQKSVSELKNDNKN